MVEKDIAPFDSSGDDVLQQIQEIKPGASWHVRRLHTTIRVAVVGTSPRGPSFLSENSDDEQQGKVYGRGGVGEGADGDEVDSGFGDGA